MRIEHEGRLGVFEHLNRKYPTHRGEIPQENFQRVTCFKVFEDDAHRHPAANEHGCSTEDIGV